MKGFVKRLAALTIVSLLLPCLLAACAKKPTVLTYSDGAFRSKDGKLAYVEAPVTYYAIRLGDVQAVISRGDTEDVSLYSVVGCGSDYLADADLNLYVAEGVTLPTLDKLGAVQAALYNYTGNRVHTVVGAVLKNEAQVADLVRIATEGEKISANEMPENYNVRLEVLFLTDPQAEIGIMLEYRKFPSDVNGHGNNFLYDRNTRCYTPVGDTLEQYFTAGEETETE